MIRLLLAWCLALSVFGSMPVRADVVDWDLSNGHFYTETNGGRAGYGFAIVDDDQARFWSEFRRIGGVAIVGYPISQRFIWNGFVSQAMQKGVLQWRAGENRAVFVNVFDQLAASGFDPLLQSTKFTPPSADWSGDTGLAWDRIVARHLALLDTNPAIRAAYYAVPDPLNLYGLPVSPVTDFGPVLVLRCQRVVLQQWKTEMPWAHAGQVVTANGGDVVKEVGLLPADMFTPIPASLIPGPAINSDEEYGLYLINQSRSQAGLPPLILDHGMSKVAYDHSADMALHNYFGHTTPAGISVATRLKNAGIHFGFVSEIIGWTDGYPDRAKAIEAIHNSMIDEVAPDDPHREAILSTRYHRVGVGIYVYGTKVYYTADFAD